MSTSRWERIAPLTGLLGVAVIVVAFAAVGGQTPDIKDSGEKVLSFYQAHRSSQMNAAFLVSIGAALLLFFASSLRHTLRQASPTGRLANTAFAGGIVAAGGFFFTATVHLALVDGAKYGDAAVVHTLNIIDADAFLPMGAGLGVMVLAAGWSALRTRSLPLWLAVVGVVAGVATFTPVGFVAFLVSGAWVIVTSVVLALQAPTARSVDLTTPTPDLVSRPA